MGPDAATGESVVLGAEVLVPGSDFLVQDGARLLLLIGILATVIAVVVRLVRGRRSRLERLGRQRRPRPIGVAVAASLAVSGLLLTVVTWPPRFVVPEMSELPRLLPEDALFYRTVTDLPASSASDRQIASQNSMPFQASFRGTVEQGIVWGVPFNLVDSDTPMVDVEITLYPETSYPGPYPISDPAYIEGMPTFHTDQHYLAVDVERRTAWELISATNWFGRWQGSAGASWSMDSTDYPAGSTIAARLPLLPGTITYDEVADGEIGHVILGSSETTARGRFQWPALGADGISDDPDAPPMGSWLRLSADADLSGLGPQAQVIARAAQRYGIILSDTGPGFNVRGTVDHRWDEADLGTLSSLTADDFEVLDATGVMVSTDSMAARPPGA